jgi:hypothetical protein
MFFNISNNEAIIAASLSWKIAVWIIWKVFKTQIASSQKAMGIILRIQGLF